MKDRNLEPRVLIAGMGNVLRQDDGFGVAVARRLQSVSDLPDNVTVIEVGTGGISLVQLLMEPPGFDVLVLLDAIQLDKKPGQVVVLEADVPQLEEFPEAVRRDFLADMHYAVPSRALVLARALGVLPSRTIIVGCQPEAYDDFDIGLSPTVTAALEPAVRQVHNLLDALVVENVA